MVFMNAQDLWHVAIKLAMYLTASFYQRSNKLILR